MKMDPRTQRMKEYFERRRREIMEKNEIIYSQHSSQTPITLPPYLLNDSLWEMAEELFRNEKKGTVVFATKIHGSEHYDFMISRHPFNGLWHRSIVKSSEIARISNVLHLVNGRGTFLIELKQKQEMSKYEKQFTEIIDSIFNDINI